MAVTGAVQVTATLQGELLKSLVTASPVKLQGQNIMVFELYLIKYLNYRSQIQIQPSLKSQIQIQIRILSVFKYKYKYVFDPNPDSIDLNQLLIKGYFSTEGQGQSPRAN